MGQGDDLEVVMLFDPHDGIIDLESHLDSIKAKAAASGFHFDCHDARNELQAATFGKRRPVEARLVVAPGGAMAIEVTPTNDSSD